MNSSGLRQALAKKPVRAKGTFVGVDIGSSAVRAAEIAVNGDRRSLRRFAQVGLPTGAVIDGEVIECDVVAGALRQLWKEGGFSTKKVVVGVSSQRVIIRPAEVDAMPVEQLRLALQFQAQGLIPIPIDEAVLDFAVLDPTVEPGGDKMRILLAAARREMVEAHLAALRTADLYPIAVDVVLLALLRATPPPPDPAAIDAVVSVGADLTSVAIRQQGSARFTRSVNIGGSKLTNSIADELGIAAAEAETLKSGLDGGASQESTAALAVLANGTRPLVDEIRSSVDYFLAQAERRGGGDRRQGQQRADGNGQGGVPGPDRVLMTGGAVQTPGLLAAITASLDTVVEVADPLARLDTRLSDCSEEQIGSARTQGLTPIGLALWGTLRADDRLNLLPPRGGPGATATPDGHYRWGQPARSGGRPGGHMGRAEHAGLPRQPGGQLGLCRQPVPEPGGGLARQCHQGEVRGDQSGRPGPAGAGRQRRLGRRARAGGNGAAPRRAAHQRHAVRRHRRQRDVVGFDQRHGVVFFQQRHLSCGDGPTGRDRQLLGDGKRGAGHGGPVASGDGHGPLADQRLGGSIHARRPHRHLHVDGVGHTGGRHPPGRSTPRRQVVTHRRIGAISAAAAGVMLMAFWLLAWSPTSANLAAAHKKQATAAGGNSVWWRCHRLCARPQRRAGHRDVGAPRRPGTAYRGTTQRYRQRQLRGTRLGILVKARARRPAP